jgi:hypothetical protein
LERATRVLQYEEINHILNTIKGENVESVEEVVIIQEHALQATYNHRNGGDGHNPINVITFTLHRIYSLELIFLNCSPVFRSSF